MNKRQRKKLYSDLPSKKFLLDKRISDYKRRRARLMDISRRDFGGLHKMRKTYADILRIADKIKSFRRKLYIFGELYIFGGDIKHE